MSAEFTDGSVYGINTVTEAIELVQQLQNTLHEVTADYDRVKEHNEELMEKIEQLEKFNLVELQAENRALMNVIKLILNSGGCKGC